ncbi:MAG: efflux RND transporter periplasmic adaptor subunit [Bacteroidales bacterium]
MKNLVFILLLLSAMSCHQKPTKESLSKEIADYKKEVQTLQGKITLLEEQLSSLDTMQDQKTRIPVFIDTIKPSLFSHFVTINGLVEAENSAAISPEISGQVKIIHVQEGDRVKKGSLLVSLSTAVIRNNLNQVESQLALATTTFKKQKELWQEEVGSEMEYLQAKTNKESLESQRQMLLSQIEMSLIKAPYNGIVDNISVQAGEMASPGMPVLQLVNLNKMSIEGNLSEKFLHAIKVGDEVVVTFPALPAIKMQVPISRLGQIIDQDSRTFAVEVKINNPGERIKPNMLALLEVMDYQKKQALVVPSIIIKEDIKGKYLYTVSEGNEAKAHKQYIEAGRSYNNQTVVVKGLKPGNKVIVSGYNKVNNGTSVEIKQPEEFSTPS